MKIGISAYATDSGKSGTNNEVSHQTYQNKRCFRLAVQSSLELCVLYVNYRETLKLLTLLSGMRQ